jgi:hypothetical protein
LTRTDGRRGVIEVHVVQPTARDPLEVGQYRVGFTPIKPVYIRKFVDLIDEISEAQ